jgi:hypothetical protein
VFGVTAVIAYIKVDCRETEMSGGLWVTLIPKTVCRKSDDGSGQGVCEQQAAFAASSQMLPLKPFERTYFVRAHSHVACAYFCFQIAYKSPGYLTNSPDSHLPHSSESFSSYAAHHAHTIKIDFRRWHFIRSAEKALALPW